MISRIIRCSVLALAAAVPTVATAQAPAGAQYVRIFISPAGEPFRATSGEYPSRAWFDLADTNHDGHLTASEMIGQAKSFFNSIDLDKNGRIDGEEIRNYENNIAPETRSLTSSPSVQEMPAEDYISSLGNIAGATAPPPQPDHRADKLKELPRGAGRFSFFNFAEPVMRADTDLSGSVTWDEFEDLQRLQFGKLDVNHRGFLEFKDLPDTPAQNMRLKLR